MKILYSLDRVHMTTYIIQLLLIKYKVYFLPKTIFDIFFTKKDEYYTTIIKYHLNIFDQNQVYNISHF